MIIPIVSPASASSFFHSSHFESNLNSQYSVAFKDTPHEIYINSPVLRFPATVLVCQTILVRESNKGPMMVLRKPSSEVVKKSESSKSNLGPVGDVFRFWWSRRPVPIVRSALVKAMKRGIVANTP